MEVEVKELSDAIAEETDLITEQKLKFFRQIVGDVNFMQQKVTDQIVGLYRFGNSVSLKAGLGITLEEASKLSGMSPNRIDQARRLTKLYINEQTLITDIQKYKPQSLGKFLTRIGIVNNPTRYGKYAREAVQKLNINNLLVEYRETKDPGLHALLTKIRNLLVRNLGVGSEISDKKYLEYNLCCCCGAEPNGEPHKLRQYKNFMSIQYPICPECIELNAEPIVDNILYLYVNYASALEKAMDAIV